MSPAAFRREAAMHSISVSCHVYEVVSSVSLLTRDSSRLSKLRKPEFVPMYIVHPDCFIFYLACSLSGLPFFLLLSV